MRKILACAMAGWVLLSQSACLQSSETQGAEREAVTVRIDSGLVSGFTLGSRKDVVAYLGVPYAEPPVGELRWKPPQPVKPWPDVKSCSQTACSCAQPALSSKSNTQLLSRSSEDCLYLNVWAPRKMGDSKLPVMVWIHGGGFVFGSGSNSDANGGALARNGVVVVTINYRLGPFGFFAHPLLSAESDQHTSGNYGLLDQIAALEWVKRNIHSFGGDADSVTVFGASAGAASILYLMVSPAASGLFQRAIIQSAVISAPTLHLRESLHGRVPMEAEGEQMAADLGVPPGPGALTALRARTTSQILAATDPARRMFARWGNCFAPVVDGTLIPGDLIALFAKGLERPVQLIVGTNANDGTVDVPIDTQARTMAELRRQIEAALPGYVDPVLALYPGNNVADTHSRIQTDLTFVAPARLVADSASALGPESKVYFYNFTKAGASADGLKSGAFHGSEIRFVFRNLGNRGTSVDEADMALSAAMSSYWMQFAATGSPNRIGLPEWPAYSQSAREYLELGDTIRAGRNLDRRAVDLFERILREQRKTDIAAR